MPAVNTVAYHQSLRRCFLSFVPVNSTEDCCCGEAPLRVQHDLLSVTVEYEMISQPTLQFLGTASA